MPEKQNRASEEQTVANTGKQEATIYSKMKRPHSRLRKKPGQKKR